MKARCLNKNNIGFKYYGGRGIKVCERWLNFTKFFEDMGLRPKGLTLERKNNELGYFKENCCWDTHTTQSRNQRVSKKNKLGHKGIHQHEQSKKYIA